MRQSCLNWRSEEIYRGNYEIYGNIVRIGRKMVHFSINNKDTGEGLPGVLGIAQV